MPKSTPPRPTRLHAHQAQEFPIFRLTLEDQAGLIQRMTLCSTFRPTQDQETACALQMESLARQVQMRVRKVEFLSQVHLEMRAHPPDEVPGSDPYGFA